MAAFSATAFSGAAFNVGAAVVATRRHSGAPLDAAHVAGRSGSVRVVRLRRKSDDEEELTLLLLLVQ